MLQANGQPLPGVVRHAIVLNPAASVRGERYSQVEGKTPMLPVEDWRKLLASLDTSNVVGMRDRTVLGVLAFTAVRAGAVARLRVRHLVGEPGQLAFRFHEKGGKSREIPIRHDLQGWVEEYMKTAGIDRERDKDLPLFRSAKGKTKATHASGDRSKGHLGVGQAALRIAGLPKPTAHIPSVYERSPTYSRRAYRWRKCSSSRATPTRGLRGFTTGEAES